MDCATLGEIIEHLESLPHNMRVLRGFAYPHSYRGCYADLAFEPCGATTVGSMLREARSALGRTFTGWKGGEYTMGRDTQCWLSEVGESSGVPIQVPGREVYPYVLPATEVYRTPRDAIDHARKAQEARED